MDSSNMKNSLKQNSMSNSKQVSQTIEPRIFDKVAGFDGKGGYHGSGGHGGNQLGIRQLDTQVEMVQQSMMKKSLEKLKHHDKVNHPVPNQSKLSAQAQSKTQTLYHTNREQRAPSFYQHNGQPDGQPSPHRHSVEYKCYEEMIKEIDQKNPQAIQLIKNNRGRHQRFATIDPSSIQSKIYPKTSSKQYRIRLDQTKPAGYGNYGPQMLTQEQLYGDKSYVNPTRRKQSQIHESNLPALKSQNEFDPMDSILKAKSSRSSLQRPPSQHVFSEGPLEDKRFNTIIEQMITGNKRPIKNPKNVHNSKLTTGLNNFQKDPEFADITSPSIFKQVPFWKNTNDQSIMSNTIYESVKKDNKLVDLDATQVSVEDPLMQNSIFTKRATPFVKGPNFDTVGTVRTAEANSFMQIESEEVSRIEKFNSNICEGSVIQKNQDPTLKQTLNQIIQGDNHSKAGTNRTYQPPQSKKLQSLPDDMSKEISKIHMYDSLILSKKPSPKKQRNTRAMTNKAHRSKNNQTDVHYRMAKMNFPQKNTSRSMIRQINTAGYSPRTKHLLPQNDHLNEVNSEFDSSSAHSKTQTILVGNQEIPVMMGAKINQLSPITKKMNKLASGAFDHMDILKKRQKAQEELRETLKLKRQFAKANGQSEDTTHDDVVNNPGAILQKNSLRIKILQNDLKSIVAPEEDKYTILMGDNPNYITVESLPNMLPVFLKLSASLQKSPIQFEVLLGDVTALQVLMSTDDKFPSEEQRQFQKESLLFKSLLLGTKNQPQKKQQKNSNLIIEANAAFMNQQPQKEAVKQLLAQHTVNEGQRRRVFTFGKPNFQEEFDDGDFVYLALLSQNGGQVKIKAAFLNSSGGYGQTEANANVRSASKLKMDDKQPEDIVEELESWYQQNLRFMDGYSYIYEARADFTRMNKYENLQKYMYQNAPFYHQQKMIDNQIRRENAAYKAVDIFEANYYKNQKNLSKWEDYREDKIELTHIFIKVMKRKNYARRWLISQRAGQIMAKIIQNLFIRRELNRVLYASYFVALRFKNTYLFRYRRQYGFDMTLRRKNELRRAFNAGAMIKYGLIAKRTNDYLANFIFKTFLVFNTSQQFTKYNDNLIYVQQQRRILNSDRENRFEMIYQRFLDLKEFLVGPACYGAKKSKYKKGPPKLIKDSLKKMFPKNNRHRETIALIKAQMGTREKYLVLENNAYLYSIKVRELTIVKQLLKLVSLKDENKESIHKETLEKIQTQIETFIKKINKIIGKTVNYGQIGTFTQLEMLDRQIHGISGNELKNINKIAKYRSAPPYALEQQKAHKYSIAQVIKDDKAAMNKCKKEIAKIKAKRVQDKKKQLQKMLNMHQESIDLDEGEGAEEEDADALDGEGDQVEPDADENAEAMDGEPNDQEMDGDNDNQDGENEGEGNDDEVAKEGDDGMDAEMGGEAGMDNEEQKEDAAADGEASPTSPSKSPKKKKGSTSKSKSKKVKKEDPNKIELLEYKKSDKTKKWIVGEKVVNPPDIMEFIKEKYPKPEVQTTKNEAQGSNLSKQDPSLHGVNAMSVNEIQELVHEMFYKVEKNKLKVNTMRKKYKYTEQSLQKMLLHMALNFEIKIINEDLMNSEENQQSPSASPTRTERSPGLSPDNLESIESPTPFMTGLDETQRISLEQIPNQGNGSQQIPHEENKQETGEEKLREKPLIIQPCLKKKSSHNNGSQGDKKSQGSGKQKNQENQEFKVNESNDANSNLPDDVPVQLEFIEEE